VSGALYACSSAIAYFVAAFVLAYLLNPAVNLLSSLRIPRSAATLFMITICIYFFVTLVLVLSPMFYHQSLLIIQKMSIYQQRVQTQIVPQLIEWIGGVSPEILARIEDALTSASRNAMGFFGDVVSRFIKSGSVAINIASVMALMPIIAFYILRDWQQIIAAAFGVIPGRYRAATAELTKAMDVTMAGYLRGQIYACLVMGVYYAIALSIIRLDSAVVLGFCSGILIVIPYVGAGCAGLFCAMIAGLQYGSFYYAVITLGIFLLGHIMESNFISPKLIGDSVGLHPAWLLFGLIVGGNLLGFFGVLIAVPLTAALGTVIKFAIAQYKRSEFYMG